MSRNIIRFDKNRPAGPGSGRHGFGRGRGTNLRIACPRKPVAILIVGDDAGCADILCGTLGGLSAFDVTVARVKTEEEARSAAAEDDFDLLFLDERLANAAAFSLARALARQIPSCAPFLLSQDGTDPEIAPAPVPNALSGLLRILPVGSLSPEGLEAAIVDGLAAARRRDGLMLQLEALGATAPEGLDQILPWMRAMLGEMNKIHGAATLAENRIRDLDDEDPMRLLQGAVAAADRMRGEMLDMVKCLDDSRRRSRPAHEPVELARLVDEAVRNCRPDAEVRGQTLTFDRPDLPLVLSANPALVRDTVRVIVRNTVLNAERDTRIAIALSIHDGSICMAVRDSCPDGHWTRISGAATAAICDAEPVLRERAGSYLLIEEMVRACDGTIHIVTTPGEGNAMLCMLPRRGAGGQTES